MKKFIMGAVNKLFERICFRINSEVLCRLDEIESKQSTIIHVQHPFQPVYLGRDLMLCKMRWGGFLVCPTWNIDVAVGYIRDGVIEEALTRYVQSNLTTGNVLVNVGANFGYYTVLGGCLVGNTGKVFSFEANPVVFPILLKTLYYSGMVDRVDCYNRAVSNIDGHELDLNFDYQYIGGGSIMKVDNLCPDYCNNLFWGKETVDMLIDENGKFTYNSGLYQHIHTKSVTLDSLLREEVVDMLLCDAECADPLVLLGAKHIIQRSQSIQIIFEWWSQNYNRLDDTYRENVRNMWEFLEKEGFKVRHLSPSLVDGNPVLSDCLTFDAMVTSAEHGDYIATRE